MALLQISEPGQSLDPHQRRVAVGIDHYHEREDGLHAIDLPVGWSSGIAGTEGAETTGGTASMEDARQSASHHPSPLALDSSPLAGPRIGFPKAP